MRVASLPPLPGYPRAATRDLNNHKQVVGQAFGLGVRPQAVLWSGKHGEPYVVEELPTLHGLNDLGPPAGSTGALLWKRAAKPRWPW